MQSHIGCICMLFLKSEFSNVSSNCLAVQMQSCIDCIWTIFHLREFSDVSSNCLPQQMQSRIDCICTLFLQIAFSYVSNHLLVTKFIKLILHLLHLLHLEEGQHPHFFAPSVYLVFCLFSSTYFGLFSYFLFSDIIWPTPFFFITLYPFITRSILFIIFWPFPLFFTFFV